MHFDPSSQPWTNPAVADLSLGWTVRVYAEVGRKQYCSTTWRDMRTCAADEHDWRAIRELACSAAMEAAGVVCLPPPASGLKWAHVRPRKRFVSFILV